MFNFFMCDRIIKNSTFLVTKWTFEAQNASKRGADSAGGDYDAPPDTLVVWEGDTPAHCPPPRRLILI